MPPPLNANVKRPLFCGIQYPMNSIDNKKFFAVLLGTLALIPLLFMMPGVNDTMANRYGVILGIGPMAMFLAYSTTCKPSDLMFFFSALFLITLGIMFFATGDAIVSMAKIAHEAKRLNENELKFMTDGMSLWLYSLPAVSIGIGVNMVSSFLTAERLPSKKSLADTEAIFRRDA